MSVELNLHGVRHADVQVKVEDFILLNEPPFKIITGNSMAMRELVTNVLADYHCEAMMTPENLGAIIVLKVGDKGATK